MATQPLQAIAPPKFLSSVSLDFSLQQTLSWLLALVTLYWIVYTVIAVHHWLRYSHRSAVAIPAIGIHLFVSLVLMGYAVSGLF